MKKACLSRGSCRNWPMSLKKAAPCSVLALPSQQTGRKCHQPALHRQGHCTAAPGHRPTLDPLVLYLKDYNGGPPTCSSLFLPCLWSGRPSPLPAHTALFLEGALCRIQFNLQNRAQAPEICCTFLQPHHPSHRTAPCGAWGPLSAEVQAARGQPRRPSQAGAQEVLIC